MIFNESKNNRKMYSAYLKSSFNYTSANLKDPKNKEIIAKARKKGLWICIAFIFLGVFVYKPIAYLEVPFKYGAFQISSMSDIFSTYIFGFLFGFAYTVCYILIIAKNGPRIARPLIKWLYGKNAKLISDFYDPHLINPNYILLTYLSADDKTKHKDEIAQVARNNSHKKVVVYTLPYRVPYIVRFDEYVFCFAVKNGVMQLLGIVQDNKDHTMPAILAQTHKVGPLMKGEEIEKNYEIVN